MEYRWWAVKIFYLRICISWHEMLWLRAFYSLLLTQVLFWGSLGELNCTLNKHRGPIFSLKWNKKGDYLLSGSVDKTAIVWNIKTVEWKQLFEFHTGKFMFFFFCFFAHFLVKKLVFFCMAVLVILIISKLFQAQLLMLIGETMFHLLHAPLIKWYMFVKLERIDQSKLSQGIRYLFLVNQFTDGFFY